MGVVTMGGIELELKSKNKLKSIKYRIVQGEVSFEYYDEGGRGIHDSAWTPACERKTICKYIIQRKGMFFWKSAKTLINGYSGVVKKVSNYDSIEEAKQGIMLWHRELVDCIEAKYGKGAVVEQIEFRKNAVAEVPQLTHNAGITGDESVIIDWIDGGTVCVICNRHDGSEVKAFSLMLTELSQFMKESSKPGYKRVLNMENSSIPSDIIIGHDFTIHRTKKEPLKTYSHKDIDDYGNEDANDLDYEKAKILKAVEVDAITSSAGRYKLIGLGYTVNEAYEMIPIKKRSIILLTEGTNNA